MYKPNREPFEAYLTHVEKSTKKIKVCMLAIGVSLLFNTFVSLRSSSAQSSDSDLSGSWSITTFGATWEVELKRDKSKEKKGDDPVYCGLGMYKENDKDVTQEICAFKNSKENKLNILAGLPCACEAPFKTEGTMEGRCVFMNSKEGAFRATRLLKKK